MISPEAFYELELKGKSAKEIKSVIRSLKVTIGKLKYKLEETFRDITEMVNPSEVVQLHWNREYLKGAKEALEEAGEKYQPTKAEQRILKLEASILHIKKIEFSIGGYFGGHEIRTFALEDDEVKLDVEYTMSQDKTFEIEYTKTIEELLDGIRDLHIIEWERRYDTKKYGVMVLDGTQWYVEIEFSNGHRKFSTGGSNAYPYNFSDFCDLVEYGGEDYNDNE